MRVTVMPVVGSRGLRAGGTFGSSVGASGLPATSGNLARVEEFRRQARARSETARKQAQTTAEQLAAVSVKITRAVGEENKMYGSVTAKDIESAYADKGISVDRKLMDLAEPIRTLGLTEVKIRLYADVTAVLRVVHQRLDGIRRVAEATKEKRHGTLHSTGKGTGSDPPTSSTSAATTPVRAAPATPAPASAASVATAGSTRWRSSTRPSR